MISVDALVWLNGRAADMRLSYIRMRASKAGRFALLDAYGFLRLVKKLNYTITISLNTIIIPRTLYKIKRQNWKILHKILFFLTILKIFSVVSTKMRRGVIEKLRKMQKKKSTAVWQVLLYPL